MPALFRFLPSPDALTSARAAKVPTPLSRGVGNPSRPSKAFVASADPPISADSGLLGSGSLSQNSQCCIRRWPSPTFRGLSGCKSCSRLALEASEPCARPRLSASFCGFRQTTSGLIQISGNNMMASAKGSDRGTRACIGKDTIWVDLLLPPPINVKEVTPAATITQIDCGDGFPQQPAPRRKRPHTLTRRRIQGSLRLV